MLMRRRFGSLLTALLLCCLLPVAAAQTPTAPGVEIDCDDKQPELDVHPLNDPVVEITCTVKNPSSFEETISVEKEWDGLEVDMMLEEDTFTLGPDEEEDFTVTFSGQTRLSASLSYDFTLSATVTNVGMLDWPEALASNASVSGDLNIATFGMVDLDVSDKSTRTMAEGDEVKISFQFQNNGNDEDKIRVSITNAAELEEAGFSFPGGTFVAEDVAEDGVSTVRELSVRARLKSSRTPATKSPSRLKATTTIPPRSAKPASRSNSKPALQPVAWVVVWKRWTRTPSSCTAASVLQSCSA